MAPTRLRAIRRQLFGASTFHRDSNVDTYMLARGMLRPVYAVQTVQVSGIYFMFHHVNFVTDALCSNVTTSHRSALYVERVEKGLLLRISRKFLYTA